MYHRRQPRASCLHCMHANTHVHTQLWEEPRSQRASTCPGRGQDAELSHGLPGPQGGPGAAHPGASEPPGLALGGARPPPPPPVHVPGGGRGKTESLL